MAKAKVKFSVLGNLEMVTLFPPLPSLLPTFSAIYLYISFKLFRKRKGGIKLEDEEHVEDVDLDEDEEKELQEERKMLEEERLKAKEAEEEEKEKKKADDLWKSFLSDVGQRPKPSSSKTEVSSKVCCFMVE